MQKPLDIRDEQAQDLLKKKGIKIVKKSTSAGLTTSVIKNAKSMGLKLAVIEPTHAILSDQTKKAAKEGIKMGYFRSNKKMCEEVKMLCKAQPWRNDILRFQYIPKKCKKCMKLKTTKCIYKKLLRREHDVIGLTYSKSEYMNKDIKNKLMKCDVILLDEITTAFNSPEKITKCRYSEFHFTDEFLEKIGKYRFKSEYYSKKKHDLFNSMWAQLFYLVGTLDYEVRKIMKEPLDFKHYGAEKIIGIIPLHEKISERSKKELLNKGHAQILFEKYARLPKFPISYLDKLFHIYEQDYLLVEKEGNDIIITPIDIDNDIFSQFFRFFNPEKQLMIISDASIPTILKLFLTNFGAKDYYWGDPLKTNQTQFIISDTIKWASKKQFFNLKKQEKDAIGKNSERIHKSISRNKLKSYFITPDASKKSKGTKYNYANIVQIDWHNKGILSKSIIIEDYHRSTNARGIKFKDKAILEFHLSRPLIPRNSFTAVSFVTIARNIQPILKRIDLHFIKINDICYSPLLCRFLVSDNEASAYINRIGRIKDQNGLINPKTRELRSENSIRKTFIINIGFRKEETLNMLIRTSARPAVIKPFKQGRLFKDAVWIIRLIQATSSTYFKSQEEIEREVPLLAYIISEAREKDITAHSVLLSQEYITREELNIIINKHEKLLFKFNIKVNPTNRGISFSHIKK